MSQSDAYRRATPVENMEILLALHGDVFSPAEKREIAEVIDILRAAPPSAGSPPDAHNEALDKLADVHRSWCNYCKGDALACLNTPAGGCSLRDYMISLDAIRPTPPRNDAVAVELLRRVADYEDDETTGPWPAVHKYLASVQNDIGRIPADGGRAKVPEEVEAELNKAISKFPTWPTDPFHALAVCLEELGELAKATLHKTYEPHIYEEGEIEKEAVQTAAMGARFVRSLMRYRYLKSEQHSQ